MLLGRSGPWAPPRNSCTLRLVCTCMYRGSAQPEFVPSALPRHPGSLQEHCIEYTRKLAEGGKFTLCVWPEHCLVSD